MEVLSPEIQKVTFFGTSCTMYMNTETKTSWNFPGERLLFHRREQAGVLRQIYFYQLQARNWLLYSTAAKMKTNYLQNISIALNQSIFFSPKAWMRHSGSGKKSWLYSLASSQGDIIYFFVVCQIIQENHNRVLIQRLVTHGQLAISLLPWKRSFWMYIFLARLNFNFFVHLPGPRALLFSLPPMSPRLWADHLHLHNLLRSF